MVFTFQMTEADYVAAAQLSAVARNPRLTFFRRKITPYIFLVSGGVFLFGAITFKSKGFMIFMTVFTGFLLIRHLYGPDRFRRRTFAKTRWLQKPMTITSQEGGLLIHTDVNQGLLEWTRVDQVVEDADSFVLIHVGGKKFTAIPKRQLHLYHATELRSALAKHVPLKRLP